MQNKVMPSELKKLDDGSAPMSKEEDAESIAAI